MKLLFDETSQESPPKFGQRATFVVFMMLAFVFALIVAARLHLYLQPVCLFLWATKLVVLGIVCRSTWKKNVGLGLGVAILSFVSDITIDVWAYWTKIH